MTRRSGDLPKGGDKKLKYQNQVVLKPENLNLAANILAEAGAEAEAEANARADLQQLMRRAYEDDPLAGEIIAAVDSGQRCHPKISLAEYAVQGGLLYHLE